ncbi:MAG TPA: bifunctional oligoribonuclease/PAP phosphatase NrnA [Bacilli bacterium]|jgi:phosphoesterase RecJ-like protein|nr:bifunctional oligoribonuclease/PAP phosphatase NrnA [Bacilli bacterium]HQC83520.1 bifunctional oligoribonuclease/PAP phosphatase NrnA [Bacilli bacterium]
MIKIFNSIDKDIIKLIKKYDEIVIARHIGPDPDAIASEIALRDMIKYYYPNKKVYAVGNGVSKFKYMGLLDKIKEDDLQNPLLIILDVPEFPRVDGANKELYAATIKIDHHPCDNEVCDLEVVDESASSTCQILAELFYANNLVIPKSVCEVLYTGIISDSDRFLLNSTSPKTLLVASRLLHDGNLNLESIYNNLYERPINERKFEAYIINNIKITENGFGYMKITNADYKKYEVDSNTASNLVNNLNFIKELRCWAFSSYDEKLGIYRINMRSRGIVINDVAEGFNGGGHKFASGARIQTEEEVDALFKALDKRCEETKE